MKTTSFAKAFTSVLVLSLAAGCAAESQNEGSEAADEEVAAAEMTGNFFLRSRTLDEEFAADTAVTELAIAKSAAGDCSFHALQAKGGCNYTDELCSTNEIMSGADGDTEYAKHTNNITGACTVAAGKLTLKTPAGELSFKAKSSTYKGKAGFVLTSPKQINKAGKEAFFQRVEATADAAFVRGYDGGPDAGLTKDIDANDPKLSPKVRAGLKKAIDELTYDENDVSSSVDEVWEIYATPFDKTPIGYGVSSSRSGDHCGGYTAVAVDLDGNRVESVLEDGDC